MVTIPLLVFTWLDFDAILNPDTSVRVTANLPEMLPEQEPLTGLEPNSAHMPRYMELEKLPSLVTIPPLVFTWLEFDANREYIADPGPELLSPNGGCSRYGAAITVQCGQPSRDEPESMAGAEPELRHRGGLAGLQDRTSPIPAGV